MDLQKKRNSMKKAKPSKTDIPLQMPLSPLMQQIHQLKSQLASIKSKKSLHPTQDNLEQKKGISQNLSQVSLMKSPSKNQNKQSRKQFLALSKQNELKYIIFPIRQYELKINLQLSKFSQLLRSSQKINEDHQALNNIIGIINEAVNKLLNQYKQKSQKNENDFNFYYTDSWQEQVKLYQQLNRELQKQNIQIKHIYAKQSDQISQLISQNQQLKVQYENASVAIYELQEQLQKMSMICQGLRQQRKQLQGKIRVYQKNIQKKQSLIIMHEEDINLTRAQYCQIQGQKRQIQKILQNIQIQYKQLKSKHQIQTQSLIKQKNKWKNQCEVKRSIQNQVQFYEDQKIQLRKQIQNLRNDNKIKSQQLSQIKIKICEQQKKSLSFQQKNYSLLSQNDKLLRSVQYCKAQMRQMTKQVQQLRQQASKYRQIALKSKLGVKNINKTQALSQIQELIKMHKRTQFSDNEE